MKYFSKTHILILLSFILFVFTGFSGVTGNSFNVGEKLKYDFNYGIIRAGEHIMQVSKIDTLNGHTTYKIESNTTSNNFVDTFYKVRDEFSTWIDTSTLATIKFSKSIREGKYNKEYDVEFDYDRMLAYSNEDTVDIESHMRDALSLFYYIRSLNLSVGDTIQMNSYDNDKVTAFNLRVVGEEKVKVPSGKYECLIIEPYIEGDFLFKYQGNLRIWISKDELRLPVMMKSKATLGSFILRLSNYTPPAEDT